MTLKSINSATNKYVKDVVRLHAAQGRKESGWCIFEGEKTIATALEKLELVTLFCQEQTISTARTLAEPSQIVLVSELVMKKMSTVATPSGLLAVFQIPKPQTATALGPGLVLAHVQDPGNMGTLIRTTAACGISTVVVIEGADPWSPKVVQSSAGTIALVTVFRLTWQELLAHKKNLKLYGLVVTAGKSPLTIEREDALLVVGNESRGIPPEWQETCDELITLEMKGSVESLNAAVAGSLALYLTFVLKH
jgi:RNA methyltransferase, TrmH family